MDIILASASPRRKQLLQQLGLPFTAEQANIDEEHFMAASPQALVEELAKAKAECIANRGREGALVIAADTIVVLDSTILGKPADEESASAMLHALSGRSHLVYTGVAIRRHEQIIAFHECSEVHFRPLSSEEIQAYVETKEPMDKAGAYGIQGLGALFVSNISGDYYNVMGLPLCRLGQVLGEFDVTILPQNIP